MPLFATRKQEGTRRRLRVLVLKSADWGFTDSSIPKLRSIVARLETFGAETFVLHNSLTVLLYGENRDEDCMRSRQILEEALQDADFAGFCLGAAEGETAHEIDVMRISGDALKNATGG